MCILKLEFMTGNRTGLVLCIHAHQPVGQKEDVLARIYEECYSPLLYTLENFQKIPVALHFSGVLLEWLESAKPEYLLRLNRLVKRGQVELLSGGFYEPILAMIPIEYRYHQLIKHRIFLEKHFGFTPKGAWLAERVWEPFITETLHDAGLQYTLLDDHVFKNAGIHDDALHEAYLTEEKGKTLKLFPISKELRYQIPFAPPEKAVDYLVALSAKNHKNGKTVPPLCVYADDMEKFGSWPGTHKLVYQELWLDRFFSLLLSKKDTIRLLTFSQYLSEHAEFKKVYPSPGSYEEMMQWCGGNFRNFFIKFPEANLMHKKMIHISAKISEVRRARDAKAASPKKTSPDQLDHAENEILRSQCNDAYWHGVFGGLYIDFLRHAVYKHLLNAENLLMNISHKTFTSAVFDADSDGKNEQLLNSPHFSMLVKPDRGAGLLELSSFTHGYNFLSLISGNFNGAPKQSFTEHFFTKESRELLSDIVLNRLSDVADFAQSPFETNVFEKKNQCVIQCVRSGEALLNSHPCRFMLKKSFTIKDTPHLDVNYEISNLYHETLTLTFGTQMCFSLPSEICELFMDKERVSLFDPSLSKEKKDVRVKTPLFSFSLNTKTLADFILMPLYTTFQSERGEEKVYQGITLFCLWQVSIAPGEAAQKSIHLKIA